MLFRLRGFPIPVDLSNKSNMSTKLIDAIESEELIAKQLSPGKKSPMDSAISVIFDIFCLIIITGFRVAEYAQTTQTKVDLQKYPSGNLVD